jgi:hypothetical protein
VGSLRGEVQLVLQLALLLLTLIEESALLRKLSTLLLDQALLS